MRDTKWRRANYVLLTAIILINGYIIAIPLLPTITYWWRDRSPEATQAYSDRLHSDPDTSDSPDGTFHAGPTADGLVIPKMFLDTPVVEGPMSNGAALLERRFERSPRIVRCGLAGRPF